MPDVKEDLLQFAWQHKILKPLPLITSSGKEIVIIKQGELNKDSGPDFFNAQIKFNEITLVGNIEVHVNSSDWIKHKHQNDNSYDNIILHVVYNHDTELSQNISNNVEVLEIKNLVPDYLLNKYQPFISSKDKIACARQVNTVNEIKITTWLQRMFIERLENKTEQIETLFESFNGDYLQTFYTLLLRNFGFKVNSLPFEILAKQIPASLLLKHSNDLKQLEALLMGTAGLLEEQYYDKYILDLQNEFEFLKKKYKIVPLKKELFKFSKLRPANFATLRLAQFASVLYQQPNILNAPQNFNTLEKINTAFSRQPEGYWKNHYHIDGKITEKDLHMGSESITNIIINTYAPFFFFYFKKTGMPEFENTPFHLLEKCKFENNLKTRTFSEIKNQLKTAVESQALINLFDNYCSKRKCLNCGIGTAILKSA